MLQMLTVEFDAITLRKQYVHKCGTSSRNSIVELLLESCFRCRYIGCRLTHTMEFVLDVLDINRVAVKFVLKL